MNNNEVLDNRDLLNAIHIAKSNHAKEPLFFEALYQAKFLYPVQIDTRDMPKEPDGSVILSNDVPLSIVSISDSSGKPFLMAFTDRNELNKWSRGSRQQTIIYSFDDYKAVLASGTIPYRGVVINPFSDNIVLGKEIFYNKIEHFESMQSNEMVMIGQPKDYPTNMVEKLKQYFRSNNLVKTAYLLWMVRGQEGSYLLVLETEIPQQQLFPKVGNVCKPYLNDKPLDMILLNSTFGQSAVEDQQPFYNM